MSRTRRHFTPEQKVALLRLHLLEHKPVLVQREREISLRGVSAVKGQGESVITL